MCIITVRLFALALPECVHLPYLELLWIAGTDYYMYLWLFPLMASLNKLQLHTLTLFGSFDLSTFLLFLMVLKTISPGCGASLMLCFIL